VRRDLASQRDAQWGYTTEGFPVGLAATSVSGDFNADGRVDLGLANAIGDNVTLLLNEGVVCGYE